jgi:hemolysin activation/secretion protein
MKKITSTLLLTCLGTFVSAVHANPTSPDAGGIQKQIEQKFAPELPQVRRERAQPERLQPQPGAATVEVKKFRFEGNSRLTTEQLEAFTKPYLGQRLDFQGLQSVADLVAQAYRESGWIVRAYLPRQEVADGNITISIVEALFGKAIITEPAADRVEARRLVQIVNAAQQAGQPLGAAAIDRALLLLDDIPGISVAGNLVAGTNPGETDLLLGVTDRGWMTGNAVVDNYGSLSTGVNRFTGSLTINSPLRQGDSLGLTFLKTTGSDYERVGYSFPVGGDGWRLGAHATNMTYKLQGSFASSDGHGSSTTTGLDASYPLVRSQLQNLNFSWSLDNKQMKNYSAGAVTSDYSIDVMGLTLAGNRIDNWMGGGSTIASATLNSGKNHLGTDTAGANTTGNYAKLFMSLARQQTLTNTLSAYVGVSTQYASKNLDSSEKLYVSGPSGVRAYQSADGSGTQGNTFTAELKDRVNDKTTASVFYDRGQVQAFKNNTTAAGGTNTTQGYPNSYNLSGYGVSVAWQPAQGSEIKATVARRIGTNPNANTTTGMDGDGTLKTNRIWIAGTFSF